MTYDSNNNQPDRGDRPKPMSFPMIEGEHECENCRGEVSSVPGINAVEVDGEIYLNRHDVLATLAFVMNGYITMGADGDHDFHIGAQVVNLLGSNLAAMTNPDRAIDLSVPDTLPDWLTTPGSNPTPAAKPESPIEAAIRIAKERILQAKKEAEE